MMELNPCLACGLVIVVGLFLLVVISRASLRSPIISDDPRLENEAYQWMMHDAESRYDGDS